MSKTKARSFYVDLPDWRERDNGGEYIHVGEFPTKKAAQLWLSEVHGMPRRVADFFITEVQS